MPGIIMHGAGDSGGDSGGGSGNSGSGKPPYGRDDRALADYTNRDLDLQARYAKQKADAAKRAEADAAKQAAAEESVRQTQERQAQAQARAQEREQRARERQAANARRQADTAYRQTRAEAEYTHRDFSLRDQLAKRRAREEAQGQARIRKAFDDSMRQARAEAEYENQRRDRAQRTKQRQDTQYGRARDAAYAENDRFDARVARGARTARQYQDQFDPGYHRIGDIARLGQRGQRAARDRDYTELKLIEAELKKIDSNLVKDLRENPARAEMIGRQREQVAIAQARVAAGKADDTNPFGGVLGAIGAIKASPWMKVASAVGELVVDAITSPELIAKMYDGLLSGATPYMNLQLGSRDIGRAGDFAGSDLASTLYPGGKTPGWMAAYGYTPQSALSTLGTYGIPVQSASDAQGILQSIGNAQLAPYLGGLGLDRYAKSANLAQTLGVHFQDEYGFDRAFSPSSPMSRNSQGGNGDLDSYWRQWQRVMTAATAAGMDHSQVMSSVEGLMRSTASAGGAETNFSDISAFWWRLAQSGTPNMRSGQGEMTALAGMTSAINSTGLNGGTAQNTALYNYFSRNGGIPKTSDALAKFLHVNPDTMSPGEKAEFDAAFNAAQEGNSAVFFQYLQPFLRSKSDVWTSVVQGSGMIPSGSIGGIVGGAISGMGTDAYVQLSASGKAPLPKSKGLGKGSISPAIDKLIVAAAARHRLDPNLLRAEVMQESTGDPTLINTDSEGKKAYGLMQLRSGAMADEHVSLDQVMDPAVNIEAGADYLAHQINASGGDVRMGVASYNQGYRGARAPTNVVKKTGYGYGQQYADDVLSWKTSFDNNPDTMNKAIANGGQIDMDASKQAYQFLTVVSSAAPALQKWNVEVIKGTAVISEFVNQMIAGMHMARAPRMP